MSIQFLAQSSQSEWIQSLSRDATLFFPAVIKDQVHWQRLDPATPGNADDAPWALGHIRAAEPVRSFFFVPREKVGEMPGTVEPSAPGKRILFGAKTCDAAALRVHRKMYLEQDFKDDFYRLRRESTLVIVADCPEPGESCFCNLVGNRPYATDDDRDEVDVALSVVEGGWLLDALSPEGEKLVALARTTTATAAQVTARDAGREAAGKRLAEVNPKPFSKDTPGRIWKRNQDDAFWSRHAADCVECYGCLMACPTCYCFLLYDKSVGPKRDLGHDPDSENGIGSCPASAMERTKVWDACYVAAYARVGGGANPRAEFVKRFYNRYFCKFSHFKTWQGMYACTGCGRCIATCMGRIDVRKALLEV